MVERRDSKGPKDLREEASPASRKDPRRDSFQMTMPAIVADLTRDVAKLKKRVAELEKDLLREQVLRAKAEEALLRRPAISDRPEKQEKPARSDRPDGSEKSDELASRMTRELRAPRRGTVPLTPAQSTPPRGTQAPPPRSSVSPTAQTQPPPRAEHGTKRIGQVSRPSQPPDRKR